MCNARVNFMINDVLRGIHDLGILRQALESYSLVQLYQSQLEEE